MFMEIVQTILFGPDIPGLLRAIDPITIGLISAGAGSLWSAWNQRKATNAQNKQREMIMNMAMPMIQHGPGTAETMLLQNMQNGGGGYDALAPFMNLPNLPSVNIGQDSILQSMRSSPFDATLQSNLTGMLQGGNPFDTTDLFSSLGALDQEFLDRQLATSRAGVSGLGQRFGGAQMLAENDLTRGVARDTAARNANIAMQSHEAAQGRRLSAAQGLLGMGQLQLGRDTGALQGMNALAGLDLNRYGAGLDTARAMSSAGLAGQSQDLQFLTTLANIENARRGGNAQLLALASGQQVQPNTAIPNAVSDIGQSILMWQLLGGAGGGGGGAPTQMTTGGYGTPNMQWNPNRFFPTM